MARAVPTTDWLNAEESTRRSVYWEYLVEKWLWRAPFALPPRTEALSESENTARRGAPSVEALQDFGYVMVPESTVSH